jgi:hypothetical protein
MLFTTRVFVLFTLNWAHIQLKSRTLRFVFQQNHRLVFALVFFVLSGMTNVSFAGDSIVLSQTSLGPLRLTGKPPKISEAKLKALFPKYVVEYEIGSGDSPDFHYFEVRTRDGEVLFTIKSFIASDSPRNTTGQVPISLLQIRSEKIRDEYGLRVGDHVEKIIAKRGSNLKFGAGHHDALIGNGMIYYSLKTDNRESPEGLTMEDAIKGNWQIRSISWPGAAWE